MDTIGPVDIFVRLGEGFCSERVFVAGADADDFFDTFFASFFKNFFSFFFGEEFAVVKVAVRID